MLLKILFRKFNFKFTIRKNVDVPSLTIIYRFKYTCINKL